MEEGLSLKDEALCILFESADGCISAEAFDDVFAELIWFVEVTGSNANNVKTWREITACVHFPRVHADLTGAFGFMAEKLYFLGFWIQCFCQQLGAFSQSDQSSHHRVLNEV